MWVTWGYLPPVVRDLGIQGLNFSNAYKNSEKDVNLRLIKQIIKNMQSLYSLLLVLLTVGLTAQENFRLKSDIHKIPREDLLGFKDSIFSIKLDMHVNINNYDLYASVNDMPIDTSYSESSMLKYVSRINDDPTDFEAHLYLGNYYRDHFKPDESEHHFILAREYLTLNDDDSVVYLLYKAEILANLNQTDEAFSICNRLFLSSPEELAKHSLMAMWYFESHQDKAFIMSKTKESLYDIVDPESLIMLFYLYSFTELHLILEDVNSNPKAIESNLYYSMFNLKRTKEIIELPSFTDQKDRLNSILGMMNIFPIIYKFTDVFHKDDPNFNEKYSEQDLKAIASYSDWLNDSRDKSLINEITYYKLKSTIAIILNQKDEALRYTQKAIDSYPIDLHGPSFNYGDMVNQMAMIYFMDDDVEMATEILKNKVQNEPLWMVEPSNLVSLLNRYILTDDLKKVEDFLEFMDEGMPKSFNTHLGSIYFNFLASKKFKTRIGLEKAQEYVTSNEDIDQLFRLLVIDQLYNGKIDLAESNITIMEKELYKEETCHFCEIIRSDWLEEVM